MSVQREQKAGKPFSIPVRTQGERASNDRAFEELLELLPSGQVASCLRLQPESSPEEEPLEVGAFAALSSSMKRLGGALQRRAWFNNEVELARRSVILHTIDLISLAWPPEEPRQGIALERVLHPPGVVEGELRESRDMLARETALDEAGLEALFKIFTANLRTRIAKGPVRIPGGWQFTASAADTAAVQVTRAADVDRATVARSG